jgi:uncharacterized protein YqgC (DUF456 family)
MSHHRIGVNSAVAALLTALVLSLASCAQPLTTREKGTLTGGTLGAATGAIIGATTGSPGAGAATGGALGAVAGALTADQLWAQEQMLAEQQRQIDATRLEVRRQREELERLARERE